MNDSQLNNLLKRAQLPARSQEFQESFSRQVIARLNRERFRSSSAKRGGLTRWGWGFAAAAACIVVAFAVVRRGEMEEKADVLQSVRLVKETLEMFPHRIRAIVQDGQGLRLVLSERNDVPSSPPLYVRICDGKQCSSLVTFSGQEIQLAGRELTVLSEANGGIIVEGSHFLWSSADPPLADGHLKIEARNLNTAPM